MEHREAECEQVVPSGVPETTRRDSCANCVSSETAPGSGTSNSRRARTTRTTAIMAAEAGPGAAGPAGALRVRPGLRRHRRGVGGTVADADEVAVPAVAADAGRGRFGRGGRGRAHRLGQPRSRTPTTRRSSWPRWAESPTAWRPSPRRRRFPRHAGLSRRGGGLSPLRYSNRPQCSRLHLPLARRPRLRPPLSRRPSQLGARRQLDAPVAHAATRPTSAGTAAAAGDRSACRAARARSGRAPVSREAGVHGRARPRRPAPRAVQADDRRGRDPRAPGRYHLRRSAA